MRGELEYFVVPAGTEPKRCRGATCGAVLFWTPSPFRPDKLMALSCPPDDPDCLPPTPTRDGVGINHHPVCADLAQFGRTATSAEGATR